MTLVTIILQDDTDAGDIDVTVNAEPAFPMTDGEVDPHRCTPAHYMALRALKGMRDASQSYTVTNVEGSTP